MAAAPTRSADEQRYAGAVFKEDIGFENVGRNLNVAELVRLAESAAEIA